jgi:hypothetical protein
MSWHRAAVHAANEKRIAELDAALTRLGYDAADHGTLEQAVLYADGARTHLMIETGCSERGLPPAVAKPAIGIGCKCL